MYASKILVNKKNVNMKSVIKLLSLFSVRSMIPSLKITLGKIANKDIIMMIMTMQNVLIISAKV